MKVSKNKVIGRIVDTQFGVTLLLLFSSVAFADRVCLEKSTGKLIEFQSGDAPLGTLTQNAVNAGYKENGVIEKYVKKEEWQVIEEQIRKPVREKAKQEEINKKQKKEALRYKLNLTIEEIDLLTEK